MSEEPLFVVTKENLESGLRGIPVGYCVTSSVDPEKGLFYCGRPVFEMTDWSVEKVIALLWYGTESKEKEMQEKLQKYAFLSDKTIKAVKALPRESHPMDLLVATLMIAKGFEGVGEYEEDALRLIAKIPLLIALVINHHSGWASELETRAELGYIENFAQAVQVPGHKRGALKEIFRLFTILHIDHGGGNLSAFVGKAVASGLQDIYGSMAAAMSALAGPRHGLANQLTLAFVKKIEKDLGKEIDDEKLRHYLIEMVKRKELLYGFGHAVLRVEDPRATVQYSYAEQHFGNDSLVQLVCRLRHVGPEVLKAYAQVASPYPNVDAVSGTLLTAAGFGYPDYYTLLFGLARTIGISIQILYERKWARGGKGTPIIRPKYFYKAR